MQLARQPIILIEKMVIANDIGAHLHGSSHNWSIWMDMTSAGLV